VPAPRRTDGTQHKLGLQVQDLTPELAVLFDVGVTSGIVVAVVESGGPAAIAGIQRGDIIVRANDTAIRSATDLEDLLQAIKPPAKLKLDIIKKGKPSTVQIDLPS
jgi:S1-C subfamily serine protease